MIGGVLGRAGQQGQKRRLADAKNGVVAWEIPQDTSKFMDQAREKWGKERRRWREDNADAVNDRKSGEAQLLEMVQAQRERAMFGEAALEEEIAQEIDAQAMAEGALNEELRKQLLDQ